MHFYDRILNFLGIPDKTGPYDDQDWSEEHRKSAKHYDTVKHIHPLYRWKTIIITSTDYYLYLEEMENKIKRFCSVLQWELVAINDFQRNRIRGSNEVPGDLKEEADDFIMEYSSFIVMKRKMDREEFYYYIQQAEEAFLGHHNINWDSELDSKEL